MHIQPLIPPPEHTQKKSLDEADAIQIWIARWLRIRPRDLVQRYGCDPRRLYEVWEETRHPGSRSKALDVFRQRYPGVEARVDPSPHRRIAIADAHPDQLGLFPYIKD